MARRSGWPPHVHIAVRGTVSRAELRQIIAATYHQVWWPSTEHVRFDRDRLPVWHEPSGNYVDPATAEILPSRDDALDAIGEHDQPLHVARFGPRFDVPRNSNRLRSQGSHATSKDSLPRYLSAPGSILG